MAEAADLNPMRELLKGLAVRITPNSEKILGCIGCQWLKPREAEDIPRANAYQIIQCVNVTPHTVYRFCAALERAGVIGRQLEDMAIFPGGRAPRKELVPTKSAIGRAFFANLVVPEVCPFEERS